MLRCDVTDCPLTKPGTAQAKNVAVVKRKNVNKEELDFRSRGKKNGGRKTEEPGEKPLKYRKEPLKYKLYSHTIQA